MRKLKILLASILICFIANQLTIWLIGDTLVSQTIRAVYVFVATGFAVDKIYS